MARHPQGPAMAAFLRRLRSTTAIVPPVNPLPSGTTVDDGSFDTPVTATTITGAVKLSGKKASGSSGKMIYSIGLPTAGTVYTVQYDPDFSALALGGKLAAVGFGFRSGGNFHLGTLKGDGATGLNVAKISGANFTTTTAPTITTIGATHFGTQAGPNWLQIETSSDGSTYTLRTSADGTTWTGEITAAAPSPLASTTAVTDFGVAAFFDSTDTGSFTIDVKVWKSEAAPANVVLLQTFDTNGADTSPLGLTVTPTGSPVFSGGLMTLNRDNSYLTVAGGSHFDFGTGDFTIEFRHKTTVRNASVMSRHAATDNARWNFYKDTDGQIYFYIGAWEFHGGGAIDDGTERHIAVTRQGSTFRMFFNGVQVATATNTVTILSSTDPLIIGSDPSGLTTYDDSGTYDDIRITKDTARYTANFTPPARGYP